MKGSVGVQHLILNLCLGVHVSRYFRLLIRRCDGSERACHLGSKLVRDYSPSIHGVLSWSHLYLPFGEYGRPAV